MKDSYRHKGLRKRLIQTLREKGIINEAVLEAFDKVPRHWFLEKAFEEWAYEDKAFPIGNQQTISQPFTVAYQTELLEIQPKDKVLEVGTGSGFQAAILAKMGARVFTVERQKALFEKTNELLQELGFGEIRTFFRDGSAGLPEHAPFDKIIVTAAARQIPTALLAQLKVGGILVIPVGQERQQMCKIIKKTHQQYQRMYFNYFRFVPLLSGLAEE